MRISTPLFSVAVAVTLGQPTTARCQDAPPVRRELRAAWVATVGNIDWPSRPDLDTWSQQAELLAILNRAVQLHLNAIIFQIRPGTDALYESKLEPWSEFLTGRQGRP
ncbi:MAG TPA: family 10 glycosylhydrolase, partial [Gemmatimonadaceae bacterium]